MNPCNTIWFHRIYEESKILKWGLSVIVRTVLNLLVTELVSEGLFFFVWRKILDKNWKHPLVNEVIQDIQHNCSNAEIKQAFSDLSLSLSLSLTQTHTHSLSPHTHARTQNKFKILNCHFKASSSTDFIVIWYDAT